MLNTLKEKLEGLARKMSSGEVRYEIDVDSDVLGKKGVEYKKNKVTIHSFENVRDLQYLVSFTQNNARRMRDDHKQFLYSQASNSISKYKLKAYEEAGNNIELKSEADVTIAIMKRDLDTLRNIVFSY